MDRTPIVLVDGCPRELPENDRIIGAGNISLSDTPPPGPQNEDIWVSTSGSIFIYSSDSGDWIQLTDPEFLENIPYQNIVGLGSLATKDDVPTDDEIYFRKNGDWVLTDEVQIPAREIKFDDTVPQVTSEPGLIAWDNDTGTLNIGMGLSNVTQQVGLETLYMVRNISGVNIPAGTVVMAMGTIGNSGRITVAPAENSNTLLPQRVMGIVTHTIPDGSDGYVTNFGIVRGIDTTGTPVSEVWNDGDILYLHPTQDGKLTKVEPTQPYRKIIIALVVHAHSTGSLMVRVTHGTTLHQVHDVSIASPTSGDMLVMNGGYWENKTKNEVLDLLDIVSGVDVAPLNESGIVPDAYLPSYVSVDDIGVTVQPYDANKLVLKSPNGTEYKLTVDDNGILGISPL